jgi:ATP synthase protein I
MHIIFGFVEANRRPMRVNPTLSLWRVVGAQVVVGVLTSLFAGYFFGRASIGYSAFYGAMAVFLPSAVFARGLTSLVSSANPGTAVMGFFVWEMAKVGLTVAMLFAASRIVSDLSWPAMLVGLVVTMKVYWLALGMRRVFYR